MISIRGVFTAQLKSARNFSGVDTLAQSPYRKRFEPEPWFSLGMRHINVGSYAILFIPEEFKG